MGLISDVKSRNALIRLLEYTNQSSGAPGNNIIKYWDTDVSRYNSTKSMAMKFIMGV